MSECFFSMLTSAVFELVQQFHQATEIGDAKRFAKVVRWFLDADDNPDSHQNLIITFWPIYNVP